VGGHLTQTGSLRIAPGNSRLHYNLVELSRWDRLSQSREEKSVTDAEERSPLLGLLWGEVFLVNFINDFQLRAKLLVTTKTYFVPTLKWLTLVHCGE